MDFSNSPATLPLAADLTPRKKQRRLSIDVLRGLTVAFMILVNNAGDGAASYDQLQHSVWNGCTLTDLVFPTFLFIMGVSLAISFELRRAKQISRHTIAVQILRRSALIFFIGLVLNALPVPHLSALRYFGVMQRIGLCYLFTGMALLYAGTRGITVAAVVSIFGYWLLLTRVPVPGFGLPGITLPVLDPHGNLTSYIDRLLIPQAHRYHFTFYDPEGLLSTIPSLATTCLGVLTGRWIARQTVSQNRKLTAMLIAGALLVVVGLFWSQTFPLNKRLWTSSYVLFTGGISLCLLSVLEWVVGRKFLPNAILEPFLAFGANALAAYVLSELLSILLASIQVGTFGTLQHYLYLLIPAALGPAALRSLIWSFLFVVACFIPMFYLRRRGIIVKL